MSEIRIFPNSQQKEFKSAEDLRNYLEADIKSHGRYNLRSYEPLKEVKIGTLALFRFADGIIGLGEVAQEPVEDPFIDKNREKYEGYLMFNPSTVKIFDPPLLVKELEEITKMRFHYKDNFKTERSYYIIPYEFIEPILERGRIAEDQWTGRNSKTRLEGSKKNGEQNMHIAFKVTYNDGGETSQVLGYKGVCSIDNIKRNIESRKVNCSRKGSPCKAFYDSGFKKDFPHLTTAHCYESSLFTKWEFGSGMYQGGQKDGQYIPLKKAKIGNIAILTTRFPGTKESERKVIGIYKIKGVVNTRGIWNSTHEMLVADESQKIELSRELAEEFDFWKYHKGIPKWGSGLFRYLEDEREVVTLLNDIAAVDRSETNKKIAKQLLNGLKSTSYRTNEEPKLTAQALRVLDRRKYGSGGEGENHKILKQWIANNPNYLGLNDVKKKDVERVFFWTNDRADIVFTCKDGTKVSVEIETEDSEPGAHQAIKYKSLLCAEQNLPLSSPKVRSFLVAYSIPDELKKFCSTYGIETVEKRLSKEEKKKV